MPDDDPRDEVPEAAVEAAALAAPDVDADAVLAILDAASLYLRPEVAPPPAPLRRSEVIFTQPRGMENVMTEPTPVAVPVDPEPTAAAPEPVLKAAAIWGTIATFIVTAVGVLVAVGVLSTEQAAVIGQVADYVSVNIVPVGSVIVGLVGIFSGGAAAGVTAAVARRHVSPARVHPLDRKANR